MACLLLLAQVHANLGGSAGILYFICQQLYQLSDFALREDSASARK